MKCHRALLCLLLVMTIGCASVLDSATRTANALGAFGDTTHAILADTYEAEQRTCVEVAEAREAAERCVALVRSDYRETWNAYRAFRFAWLGLATLIHAAKLTGTTPDLPALLASLSRLASAHTRLSRALSGQGITGASQ
jgi:hypothetical protein